MYRLQPSRAGTDSSRGNAVNCLPSPVGTDSSRGNAVNCLPSPAGTDSSRGNTRQESRTAQERRRANSMNMRGVFLHVLSDALGQFLHVLSAAIGQFLHVLSATSVSSFTCSVTPSGSLHVVSDDISQFLHVLSDDIGQSSRGQRRHRSVPSRAQ